jgi:hypothetical protein
MAVPPYVTAGNVIEETWGDQIADSVVNPFASTAARSAAIAAPTNGMTTTITAASALNGFEVYNGVRWTKPWSSPWGTLYSATTGTTQTQSSSTTETSIKNTPSFTAFANRYYKITLSGTFYNTVSDAVFSLRFRLDSLGGTELFVSRASGTSQGQTTITMSGTVGNLTAGAHSIYYTVQRISGTGTGGSLDLFPMYWNIEDIGPSGAPA